MLSVLTTTDIQHRCSRLVCIFPCACAWGSKPLPAPCPPMKVLDPADSQRVLSNPVTLCGSRDTDGDVHAKGPRHWRGSELLWPVFAVCKHCYCAVMNLNPVPGNAIPTETPARIPRPTLRMPPPHKTRDRTFYIYDCDQFTREYYEHVLGRVISNEEVSTRAQKHLYTYYGDRDC